MCMCYFLPVLYYWTLFFPSLSGGAILLIASLFGGYGGLICAVLFPWLARSIFSQYHRMISYQRYSHITYQFVGGYTVLFVSAPRSSAPKISDRFFSRLANPIYLGTLLAGVIHSLVCFYGKMMPNILKRVYILMFKPKCFFSWFTFCSEKMLAFSLFCLVGTVLCTQNLFSKKLYCSAFLQFTFYFFKLIRVSRYFHSRT